MVVSTPFLPFMYLIYSHRKDKQHYLLQAFLYRGPSRATHLKSDVKNVCYSHSHSKSLVNKNIHPICSRFPLM